MEATVVARGPQIILVQSDGWHTFYEAERTALERVAGEFLLAFEHVGSTAISGLVGKPVIDILAGARSLADANAIAAKLSELNYIQIPFVPATAKGEPAAASEQRLFFLKRPVESSEGVDPARPGINVHVVAMDMFHRDGQLVFRDYLRKHPELIAQYGRLKCELVAKISAYREYMPGKAAFIEGVLASAQKDSESHGSKS